MIVPSDPPPKRKTPREEKKVTPREDIDEAPREAPRAKKQKTPREDIRKGKQQAPRDASVEIREVHSRVPVKVVEEFEAHCARLGYSKAVGHTRAMKYWNKFQRNQEHKS